MSWLARSIANSLRLDDDEDDVTAADKPESKPENSPQHLEEDDSSPNSPSRGVKEDLSELSKTLTRQFWGVASFLAPPPQSEPRSEADKSESDPDYVPGIRTDFAEIGGKFKTEISRLSNNINVSEITKMASSFLQLGSEDEDEHGGKEDAIGVTEEVVAFVRDITMHPETWLDFPLPENAEDYDDFDLSNAQQEHALAVERLVPRLAALRMELCPGYMSDTCFWKIYFVLLHPRLDKQEAELLSTPQILKARTFLGQELKNRTTIEPDDLGKKSFEPNETASPPHEEPLSVPSSGVSQNESKKSSTLEISTSKEGVSSEAASPPVESIAIQTVEKPAVSGKHLGQVKNQDDVVQKDGDDADDWLKEEDSEVGAVSGTTIPIENEDDVSFSDLEEDDGDVPVSYRKSNFSSDKDSQDWVQLGKSSSDIDDIDVA